MVIYNETLKQKNPGVLTNIDSQYASTGKYDKEIEEAKKRASEKKNKKEGTQEQAKAASEKMNKAVMALGESQKTQAEWGKVRNEMKSIYDDRNKTYDALVRVMAKNPNGLNDPKLKATIQSQLPSQTENWDEFTAMIQKRGLLMNKLARFPKDRPIPKDLEKEANSIGLDPKMYTNPLIRNDMPLLQGLGNMAGDAINAVGGAVGGAVDAAGKFLDENKEGIGNIRDTVLRSAEAAGTSQPNSVFGGYAKRQEMDRTAKEKQDLIDKEAEQKEYERKQADKLYNYQVGRDKVIDDREKYKLNLSEKDYELRKKQLATSFVTNLTEQIINLKGEFDFNMMGDMFSFYDSDMKDSEILLEELKDTKQLDKLFERASKYSNGDLKKFGQYVAKFGTQYRLTPLKKEMEARWNKKSKEKPKEEVANRSNVGLYGGKVSNVRKPSEPIKDYGFGEYNYVVDLNEKNKSKSVAKK